MAFELLKFVATAQVSVSTSILRVGGASSWTGQWTRPHNLAQIDVANNDAALTVYLVCDTAGAAIGSQVSTTKFIRKLGPGESGSFFVGQKADLFIVGTVGRLAAVKHQRLLVEAFVRACGHLPEAAERMRLVIAGDGPDRAAIERQVGESGMADRIWIAGARDDVSALLAGLDLFVLPSLAEGISNTILEAMASGLAVIATRVGGNAELVADGSTGMLVPSDDADAMASAIAAYAIDRRRAKQQGGNGRALAVSRFSIDTMIACYANLYDTLLESRRPIVNSSSAAAGAIGASRRPRRDATRAS